MPNLPDMYTSFELGHWEIAGAVGGWGGQRPGSLLVLK